MEKIEYKRTCKKCGRTWYVPQEYLKKLKSGRTDGTLAILFFDVAQGARNKQAIELEMMKIKMCPNCNSSDYQEEIEKTNQTVVLPQGTIVKEEKGSKKTILIAIIITVIIIAILLFLDFYK